MRDLILASHGRFSEELKGSVEMIMGEQPQIHTITLLPKEGEDDFVKKLNDILSTIDGEPVFFTDLLGGSPCNFITKQILGGKPYELYAGMNMPMVIQYLNDAMLENDFDVKKVHESMVKVNDLLVFDDDDDE